MDSATTHELLASFLDSRRARNASPLTLRAYALSLGQFLAWRDERQDAGPITRATIRAYIAHLQGRGLAPATTSGRVRDLSVWLGWLVDEEILTSNPAFRMKPRTPKRRPPSYTGDQIRALLRACDGEHGARDRAMIIMLLDTGLRASELASLARQSFDWASGAFSVVGKGNKERKGWAGPYALEILRLYLATREDDHPALWLGQGGGPLTYSGIYQALRSRAELAGISGEIRKVVHGFRATFAKNYIQQGGDLESLRRLLGHESIVMSAHYAQLADDELAGVKARVNPLGGVAGL